jgi:hypothetical protein
MSKTTKAAEAKTARDECTDGWQVGNFGIGITSLPCEQRLDEKQATAPMTDQDQEILRAAGNIIVDHGCDDPDQVTAQLNHILDGLSPAAIPTVQRLVRSFQEAARDEQSDPVEDSAEALRLQLAILEALVPWLKRRVRPD